MDRYICIHGHFYQPPRENPWLEAIELQESAYPYHDWNERIAAECYAPNAVSRILDAEGRIDRIVNNYARISFNVGPTLLSWIEDKAPDVYRAILEADRESARNFSGHGSALAQPYNHIIMPLATRCDKQTQIEWGLSDFKHRFQRSPEGMWLPETAVDLETLDLLAEHGILFTILSPYQAARARKIGSRHWHDASGGRIDPTMPYLARLPSRRTIALFFYDGPISRAVAFEGLLYDGQNFARRLMSGFSDQRTWPQLVHIATDGESYGHHHRYGEMALSYALHHIESQGLARITNYGEHLERFPPSYEVEIVENTAWSCAHGVERWRSNCGCSTGGQPGWTQDWRTPLRDALDWLRDRLADLYEREGKRFFLDPWKARDAYIEVVLNRHFENVQRFLEAHALHPPGGQERVLALRLLEIARHAMLMYTSCGWFFTDLSGLETVQVLQYAGRAIQLAQEFTVDPIEEEFLTRLAKARSNIPDHGDGARVYEKFVRPAMVDLAKVGAHYAMSSLFEHYPERARIYSYTVERIDFDTYEAGSMHLAVGQANVISEITLASELLSFGVLHFGDHNLTGGVRHFRDQEAFTSMRAELVAAFGRADLPEAFRLIEREFPGMTYSLKQLFRDQQRKILDLILKNTVESAEAVFRQTYERNVPLMRFLSDLPIPVPRAFLTAAEFALNSQLRAEMQEPELNQSRIQALINEARITKAALDSATLEYALRENIARMAAELAGYPADLERLARLDRAVALARSLPFDVNLWSVENVCYELWQSVSRRFRSRADQGREEASAWLEHMQSLGRNLKIRME